MLCLHARRYDAAIFSALLCIACVRLASAQADPELPSDFYQANAAEVTPVVTDVTPVVAEVAPVVAEVSAGDQPQNSDSIRSGIPRKESPTLRRDSIDSAAESSSGGLEAQTNVSQKPPSPQHIHPETANIEVDNSLDLPTVEELEGELASIQENKTLDDQQRETLITLAQQSLESLKKSIELEANSNTILAKANAVPTRINQIKESLRNTPVEPELPNVSQLSTLAIQNAVQELQDELALKRQQVQEEQARADELETTRKESQQRLQKLAATRAEVQTQLDAEPAGDITALQRKLQLSEWRTHIAYLNAREKLIKAEAKYARALSTVRPLQNDLDVRIIARTETLREHFAEALKIRQQQELQIAVEAAREQARSADPDLQILAKHNLELAKLLAKYHSLLNQAADELASVTRQFDEQEKSFHSIQEKVEEIGMTEAIGILLRSQDHQLIDDRPLRKRAAAIAKELPQVELTRLTAKEERAEMSEIESLIDEYAGRVSRRLPEDEARLMVRELLEARRDHLDELQGELGSYEQTLGELHIALKNTSEVTRDHHRYIAEHVLWTRSSDPISASDIEESRQGLAQLFAPNRWIGLVSDLGHTIQRRLVLSLSCFAGLVIGLILIDRLKDRISDLGETKTVQADFRFAPTAEVVVETLLLAGIGPAICFVTSLCIASVANVSDLAASIGVGLQWVAVTWLGLGILQQVVRPGGLAEAHFRWHNNNIRVIRRSLRLLLLFGLPAQFIVMMIETFNDGRWASSLGRLSFITGMAVMTLFMDRMFTPYRSSSGIWANRDVWLYRVRHVIHALTVLVPISLAGLTAIGYGYSAHQLAYRANQSLWLAILVMLSHAMINRYFTIARRNAAVRHMHRKRAESEENESEIPTEDELDFRAIGDQLQRLLRGGAAVGCLVGLSFIWADMVPALKMLDQKQLWTTTQIVTENVDEGGKIEQRTEPRIVPVTVADLLLSLLTISGTVVAGRNIPGLLNVTILERLPIDYGTRYAMTAVSRYVISLIGIVAACQFVGITWSSVQWLVAAMTVGLGFGLQEIFANFVSGLIILMERPIRVGDMVTVGGIMGKVTRVQIRATTIIDFDRRELVVPNRRFITEDVINWTLSDPITRVVLKVGIAYQCDPQLAREKLLEVASKHPLVLSDPAPNAVFVGFGDSTLDIELRVFIVGRDQEFEVRDHLNLAINKAFKDASLEIAYPQRDLHIRSMDAMAATVISASAKTDTMVAESSLTNQATTNSKEAA